MATKTIRLLLDDMEEGEVEADDTVKFGLDGKEYEIDLSKKNATRLRKVVGEFADRARPAERSRRKTKTATAARAQPNREHSMAIREWARNNGYPNLTNRGRIPDEVLDKFEKEHKEGAKTVEPAV